MKKFNLAISYVWEFDEEFIHKLEPELQSSGLTTFIINENNYWEVTELLRSKKLGFDFYLDRASDADEDFDEIAELLQKRRTKIINPYKNVEHAIDKATMHLEFLANGIDVPYSIIVPPHSKFKDIFISVDELSKLGSPFIVKPCNTTGGGIGVVTGAETLKDVLKERVKNCDDKYIIQQKVIPKFLNGRRAWFRCFSVFGKSICLWWDDQTHLYKILTNEEVEKYKLKKLFTITNKITRLTKLDFFSTEIAVTENGKFIVIDYVNDQCDMRLHSNHIDGVPDEIVQQIIINFKNYILRSNRKKKS